MSWPISAYQDISSGIEKLFVDYFEDRGLDQCIILVKVIIYVMIRQAISYCLSFNP